jgi:hypothetical protein
MRTSIIILIFVLTTVCNAQLTNRDLDRIFESNSPNELYSYFSRWNNLTVYPDSVLINDTISLIYSLYKDACLITRSDSIFFILQSDFPFIEIDGKRYVPDVDFIFPYHINGNIPLRYNSQNISDINSFFGPDPFVYDKGVKKYLNSTWLFRKLGYWNAKNKIKKYESKINFIGEYLLLPKTWTRLMRSLVPYRIVYISFSKDLKQAEIRHELASSGEIAIYKKIKGSWIKTETKMTWID